MERVRGGSELLLDASLWTSQEMMGEGQQNILEDEIRSLGYLDLRSAIIKHAWINATILKQKI